jgi:hypothetical protein
MNPLNQRKQLALRLCLALPLLFALQATPAHAAGKAAPAATTTIDVCHNEATGNWRYSGVVALSGRALEGAIANVDYWIQNQTSPAGYSDKFKANRIEDGTMTVVDSGRLTRFSIETAALSVGTLQNVARITLIDPLAPTSPPLKMEARLPVTEAVCGCPVPKGCVRTQGYWGNKPDVVWPSPYNRNATFFSSGLTWQQIMDTPPAGGNAYVILAHQYIAAVLNRAAGASAPTGLTTIISSATAWFASGTNLDTCSGSECATQKNWAAILDTYNNGLYPGAPKACD